MKRRQLLVTGGIASLSLGLAGCVQDDTPATGIPESKREDVPETPGDNRPSVSKQPRNIRVSNNHKHSHELIVDVEFEEERLHNERYKLPPGSSEVIEGVADEIGGYTITVNFGDGQKASGTWSVTDDSTVALVTISQNEELRFTFNPDL